MPRPGPYDLDDYTVYHEENESVQLLIMELNSAPVLGSHLIYTPLEGAEITYKVERIDLEVEQTVITAGSGPGASGSVVGYKTVPKVIVSTVVIP